jgi:hypothetical protein
VKLSHDSPSKDSIDQGLATSINAWDRWPEAVRAGIVAMVKAAIGND